MTTAVAEPRVVEALETDQQEVVEPQDARVVAQHVQSTKPRGITNETWRSLTSKAKLYVAEYIQHGNTLKAYRNAGYTRGKEDADIERHKAAAYQIRKGKRVRAAILEHSEHRADLAQAKKDYALDWIVSEHERLMKVAETKGDLAVATRNLELIGKTRGVYVDSVAVDVAARREYSEVERIEAMRLGRLLLEDAGEEPVEDQQENGAGKDQQQERERGKDGKFVAGESSEATDAPRARSSLSYPSLPEKASGVKGTIL